MNIVVHMTECKPHSTIASARVARFIVETLPDMILVDTEHRAKQALINVAEFGLDKLIIVNGPMAFCDFLEPLARLVDEAKQVIWCQQDYTINPPAAESKAESPFRKAFADKKLRPVYWTTVEKNVKTELDSYVNWNQLTWDLQELPELSDEPILFYYGAFREKRLDSFNKWFKDAPYQVHVSTTTLRGKKFKAIDENIKIVPPFTSLDDLPRCSATLYIEDARSSKEFHSPANRFYEMLSAGIPMFFEANTVKMLSKAGVNVPDKWIVADQGHLSSAMEMHNLDDMRQKQRAMWSQDYIDILRSQLMQAWGKL